MAGPGWDFDSIEPYLLRAERTIKTRPLSKDELASWARAVREAAPEVGIPILEDLNDLSRPQGTALAPINVQGFARWNTAFSYLDVARAREREEGRGWPWNQAASLLVAQAPATYRDATNESRLGRQRNGASVPGPATAKSTD